MKVTGIIHVMSLNRRSFILLFVSVAIPTFAQHQPSRHTIEIKQPTVIAWFPPPSSDPDSVEALSDYELYTSRLTQPLGKRGVKILNIRSRPFQIKIHGQIIRYKPTHAGYYFLAPGREPHIETGVLTDSDILEVAKEVFRIAKSEK